MMLRRVTICALLLALLPVTAASAETRHITLVWDASVDATVTGYIVYSGAEPGVYSDSKDVGNSLTWSADLPGPQYYFAVRAYDESGNLGPFSLEVGDTAGVLLTNPGSQFSDVETDVSLRLIATGTPVVYSALNLPAGLGVNPATAWITGTVDTNADVLSPYIVTARVSDPTGSVSSVQFVWTVKRNHPPVVNSPGDLSAIAGGIVTRPIQAWDPDGGALTFSAAGLPAGLGLDAATGIISGTVALDAAPSYAVTITASDGSLSTSVNFPWTIVPAGVLAVDQIVNAEGFGTAVTTAPFSTSVADETLIAFAVAAQPTEEGVQVASVTGGGLTWSLVTRANAQAGTAEIWQATATGILTDARVTATVDIGGDPLMLTVISFAGSNGVGASAAASASSGAPTVTLTTTKPGSFVLGAGNDWDQAVPRTPALNQTIVHEFITSTADSYWVQDYVGPIEAAGTTIALLDTDPTTDRWNFSAVEIVPKPRFVPSSLTIDDVSVAEGDSGTSRATFTVRLTPPSPVDVTVDYTTVDGSATAGSDYVAKAGTLTFPAGATARSVVVKINGDTTVESDETFFVKLGGATNANMVRSQAIGTIVNDDVAPDGRMFGYGRIDDGRTRHRFLFRVTTRNNRDYARLEYWSADDRNDEGDRNDCDGDHDGDYGRSHRGTKLQFVSNVIGSVTFSDDPAFTPGRGRGQPTVDSVVFTGTGAWNGKPGYTFEVRATDQGEPGRQRDTFSLVVKDSRGSIVANVGGKLVSGEIESTRLSRGRSDR